MTALIPQTPPLFLPGLGDLSVPVLVHDELGGLTRWVDDQGVAVEALDHDGVLSAKVISWKGICLPAETVICIGEVLCVCVCVCVCVCIILKSISLTHSLIFLQM